MDPNITLDPYRYVNWIIFVLSALINSFPTQAFAGVGPIIKQKYQISQFQSNIPSIIYPVCYIFLLLPANYILDKKGLKIGQVCMIIGLSIRLLINTNIYFFYIGTLFCGLGFCFIISAANKFANVWFPRKQIFMVSTICVFCIFASDAIGTSLSAFFIQQQSTKDDIFYFFLIQSIVMISVNVVGVLLFKNAPKTKQNYASVAQRSAFKEDLKQLMKNKNYIYLFLSITFVFSAFTVMFVFLPWIIKAYALHSSINRFIFLTANACGFISCGLVGYFSTNLPYRVKCKIQISGFLLCLGIMYLAFQLKNQIFILVGSSLVGMFAYPFLTTVTDFSTQTSFPIGQATSSGILLFGGQTLGVILVTVFSFIFNGQSIQNTRILCLIIFLLSVCSFVSVMFTKQILKRQQYELIHQKNNSLIDSTTLLTN